MLKLFFILAVSFYSTTCSQITDQSSDNVTTKDNRIPTTWDGTQDLSNNSWTITEH